LALEAVLQYLAVFSVLARMFNPEGWPTFKIVVVIGFLKQAQAYREMSLLLRRPPGREAFQGL
jgi:F-type H+-transporting ATPase subunit alpha